MTSYHHAIVTVRVLLTAMFARGKQACEMTCNGAAPIDYNQASKIRGKKR